MGPGISLTLYGRVPSEGLVGDVLRRTVPSEIPVGPPFSPESDWGHHYYFHRVFMGFSIVAHHSFGTRTESV